MLGADATKLLATVAKTPAGSPEQLQLHSFMTTLLKLCSIHKVYLDYVPAWRSQQVFWVLLELQQPGLLGRKAADVVSCLPTYVLLGRYYLHCAQQLRRLQLIRPNFGQLLLQPMQPMQWVHVRRS